MSIVLLSDGCPAARDKAIGCLALTRAAARGLLLATLLMMLTPPLAWSDDSAEPVDGAGSPARLENFMQTVDSFSANFEQTLYDADSEPLQHSTGTVVLKRPGRFRWDYDAPLNQQIVADGTRVWLYDEELAQVTVNNIDERVAGTPLLLLMGDAPLADAFAVSELGNSDGIDWLELTPVESGGDFETVFIGLDGDVISALELRDSFGQATQIRFSDFKADVAVDDASFEFEVPDGVDVIGLEE